MSDNVFILGAGFSYDAGIPLLGGFIQKMRDFASGRKHKLLSKEDKSLFLEAISIIEELEPYHGRSNFDDRNIEDVLSILTFNYMGGGSRSRNNINIFNKAITRVIELSSLVQDFDFKSDRGCLRYSEKGRVQLYLDFWDAILSYFLESGEFPVFITFNYDLVLERSLAQLLTIPEWSVNDISIPKINLSYSYKPFSEKYLSVVNQNYFIPSVDPNLVHRGIKLVAEDSLEDQEDAAKLEILKLHGSVNFPRPGIKYKHNHHLSKPNENPLILPPIFNKTQNNAISKVWARALNVLRSARNCIFVGYSLPRTDVYMSYFLKAALGPNSNLENIHIFDPCIYQNEGGENELIGRYKDCFSPQTQRKMHYRHEPFSNEGFIYNDDFSKLDLGTTKHMIQLLKADSSYLLY
ncbi:MAG: hypothetical protein WD425_05500 [Nitrospirales bacterium]